ncbi:hypothetical protein TcWFU_005861 [Taenia crassiceps]|uniref:BHLH domain-containing protein n=1 Tax=Taenia crassiceps TaxID=6207 RepID=A0ABR4QGD5_9CEST
MFHTPTVNVVSAPPTSTPLVEDVKVAPPTCTRQRIDSRRVKKQKTERVRRARIAEKIAQLHGLALSMVGVEADAGVRTEKVEMLGFCHEVLSSLHDLLVQRPDMMERLKACHRSGTVTSAVCRNTTCDCSTTCQIGCCEGGVYAPSTPVPPSSSSVESGGVHCTDCRLPLKKRQVVWRPYL